MTAPQILSRPRVGGVASRPTRGAWLLDNDVLPRHHFIDAGNQPDLVVGTVGLLGLHNNNWWFSTISWTTTAGGELGWYLSVAAGTWTLQWFIDKRNDYGIGQAKVDGQAVGPTIDRYVNNATAQMAMHIVEGVQLTRGEHLFSFANTGAKNAASSGFLNIVCGFGLTRTDV